MQQLENPVKTSNQRKQVHLLSQMPHLISCLTGLSFSSEAFPASPQNLHVQFRQCQSPEGRICICKNNKDIHVNVREDNKNN